MKLAIELNAEFIDSQYRLWKSDPNAVPRDWGFFFEGFELAGPAAAEPALVAADALLKQSRVDELVHRYREIGHLLSCLDPLVACPTEHPLLDLSAFELSIEDLDKEFITPTITFWDRATLGRIVQMLKQTYCRTVGVEYMHIQDPAERLWLQERMEPVRNRPAPGPEEQRRILRKLCEATLFEQFLNNKYLGQKRFSLEGAEAVIAMLDALLRHAAGRGCLEIILGMAHRGRLNVQVNILGKPYEEVFCEFEDNYDPDTLVGSGDVKYHKGYLTDLRIDGGGSLRIHLVNNPSHLESVDPVVEGVAYARQRQRHDADQQLVLPLLIHGDASFSGEGVVYETLNLSQLEGYGTGGTLHLIINNQIGFTTLPESARSTRYSTDVAKMLMAPIFHVHGEDPEAAVHVIKLAYDYRCRFGKDVVIDVVCYRRYGHNEGDEPYFTQPRMYERIKGRPSPYRLYGDQLLAQGVLDADDMAAVIDGVNNRLEKAFEAARQRTCILPQAVYYEGWDQLRSDYSFDPVETGVAAGPLLALARKASACPNGFAIFDKLERIVRKRLEVIEKGEGIDWASAEMLAFASLLAEGVPVRLSGQDSGRGTFSQRHSVLIDTATEERFIPLNHLVEGQAPFQVLNSMLSENAVLGFEYGYSLVDPRALVIWEAQFGDFANNAQAIIDQYIAAAEAKWRTRSGLVLLLPHGYEGMGPEHSSARLERFLQLCAEDNIQVCYPSTPAQYFHLLRRQIKSNFRKPLIVMAPKSLLRHPQAVSPLSEMTGGGFREVLDEVKTLERPARILLCSGKIYYDLMGRREKTQRADTAILRIEQLYPFPNAVIKELTSRYADVANWFWVQEEPENMGAWRFVRPHLEEVLGRRLQYIGRQAAASPATGYHSVHQEQQQQILEEAIEGVVNS